ncbi:MAG: NUDIX hydrolase [Pseudomonadota bacterium]
MFTGDRTSPAALFRRAVAWLRGPKRRQAAALCWRPATDGVEVLLVTTKRTRRWTPPKGGVMKGEDAADAAVREAWEEAGVVGEAAPDAIGAYDYLKLLKDGRRWERRTVDVFAVKVGEMAEDYPEEGQRSHCWVAPADAGGMVHERMLRQIVGSFSPARDASSPD